MDNTLRMPLPIFVTAVILFPTPGLVLLVLDGSQSSAFLIVLGMFYAAGLGRALLWRRLGRPALPPAPSRRKN
jgi:hypothetical protein